MPAKATYAELERRVLEGDTSVTAAQLAAAREQEHLEQLRARADDHQAAQAAEAAADAARDEVRREHIEPLRDLLDELRPSYDAAVSALGVLQESLRRYEASLKETRAAARRVGITAEVDAEFPALDLAVFTAAVADGRGEPLTVRRGDGPERLRRHPLHTDDYVAEVNAALAAAHEERLRRIAADREQRRQRWQRRRDERAERLRGEESGLQLLTGRELPVGGG